MLIYQKEDRYGEDYQVFFEVLAKFKAHLKQKHPEVSVDLMYNLRGKRAWAAIQTLYPSPADYERIDADMDNDENYSKAINHHPRIPRPGTKKG